MRHLGSSLFVCPFLLVTACGDDGGARPGDAALTKDLGGVSDASADRAAGMDAPTAAVDLPSAPEDVAPDAPMLGDVPITTDTPADLIDSHAADIAAVDLPSLAKLVVEPSSGKIESVSFRGQWQRISAPTFVVRNDGETPSGPLHTALVGPAAMVFKISQDSCNGVVVAPQDECAVVVDYTYSSESSASLTITDTAGSAVATASLVGHALEVDCVLSSTSFLDLGTVSRGTRGPEVQVELRNLCTAFEDPVLADRGHITPAR